MITLGWVYALAGAAFAAFAVDAARDRTNPKRWGNGAFWALVALAMLAGDQLGDFGNGLVVIALALLGDGGALGRGAHAPDPAARRAAAERHGNRLFATALIIPLTALAGTVFFRLRPGWADPRQATLIALALGVLIALAIGLRWFRLAPLVPVREARRLIDAIGWAALLPQLLACLGAIFALAGVGGVVGRLIGGAIPPGSLIGAVLAYTLGMALFTMVMGNAFAAFPVMSAAVGVPLLIHQHHGHPAAIAAMGMLAGFSGTLLTPMAANFNLVPAALLELRDRHGVIRAQAPTALALLAFHTAAIYWLAFG